MHMFIQVAVSGYRSLLRKLALKALFAKPTSEDPTLPILYRNTTGFATENQVIPPRNGLMEFETGTSQEHHLASNGVTEDILKKMKKLIVDKGGNGASVAIWASESLYVQGNSKEQFYNILEHNLHPVYDSAKLQGYDIWLLK